MLQETPVRNHFGVKYDHCQAVDEHAKASYQNDDSGDQEAPIAEVYNSWDDYQANHKCVKQVSSSEDIVRSLIAWVAEDRAALGVFFLSDDEAFSHFSHWLARCELDKFRKEEGLGSFLFCFFLNS